jgi:hypothetical protein
MSLRLVVAVAVLAVGVASTAKGFGFSREILASTRAQGAGLTAEERVHSPGDTLPLAMDRFDFWRQHLSKDDRYWLDVHQTGFGQFLDLPSAVAALSRFYLLPAVQSPSLAEATVVLSWDEDPARLGLRYWRVDREGSQLVYAAHVAR